MQRVPVLGSMANPHRQVSGSATPDKPSGRLDSAAWLAAYFISNLALTIYNKLVLAGNFPFPYTLTAVHCLFGTIGSWICLSHGVFVQARLKGNEVVHIVLFSGLYTINIIVSNVSLCVVAIDDVLMVGISSPFRFIRSSDRRVLYSLSFYPAYSYQKPFPRRRIFH